MRHELATREIATAPDRTGHTREGSREPVRGQRSPEQLGGCDRQTNLGCSGRLPPVLEVCATYSSTLRNCMGLPWRDFLTLLRPSRRLTGIRDEPGILDGV